MAISNTNNITLREVTESTVRTICNLETTEHQRNFVAPNAVSIAQAYFSERAWFRAIYHEDTPVGFMMLSDDPDKGEYYLWRFMIAKEHQGKGYGSKAMDVIIEHVKTRPNATELTLSCVPGDDGPEQFYIRRGFEFTGEIDEGEKVYRLKL